MSSFYHAVTWDYSSKTLLVLYKMVACLDSLAGVSALGSDTETYIDGVEKKRPRNSYSATHV